MSNILLFSIFYLAIFLQGGAYGLTFLLPELYESLSGNEKDVGITLFLSAISTIVTILSLNRLNNRLADLHILALACGLIAISLFLFPQSQMVGLTQYLAAILLGMGWGITYSLAPITLAKITSDDMRIRYFALLSVALMAGFGGSPILHAFMMDYGYFIKESFILVAIFAFISSLLFILLQSISDIFPSKSNAETSQNYSFANLKKIYRSNAFATLLMVLLGACVFAGMNNFQTVFAKERNVDYSHFFMIYTLTVVFFRALLAGKSIGNKPYKAIGLLQILMMLSALMLLVLDGNLYLYAIISFFFALGYGVSYPILAAQTSKDADQSLMSETMQIFALSYFIGIFGFPLLAGWMIVELGSDILLYLIAFLAFVEISMAFYKNKQAA